jgi:RNA-binding protein Tab2/Atab2
MSIWQADFYRRPLQDETGQALWELVVCDPTLTFTASAFCPQSQANSAWIAAQLQQMAGSPDHLPKLIQVFRPQSVSLIQAAAQPLAIAVEPTRRTPALKQHLQARAEQYPFMDNYTRQPYQPIALEQPPPTPLPENLWGERWRFAAIAAADLEPAFGDRPIPICSMPSELLPIHLQLPSTLLIPGVVIDGGKLAMRLARWLQQTRPIALNYIPGEPDGLILEAGLVERWVVATFTDPEVIAAAQTFRQRQQASKGLHFLLVQPDDTGVTYSGFWLLQP